MPQPQATYLKHTVCWKQHWIDAGHEQCLCTAAAKSWNENILFNVSMHFNKKLLLNHKKPTHFDLTVKKKKKL